jgi:hypothetical protein
VSRDDGAAPPASRDHGTAPPPASRDGGTVLPLLVVSVVLAVTVLAAATAGSRTLLERRRLVADCDAAALAGAAAVDRRLRIDLPRARAAVRAALPPTTAAEAGTDGAVLTVRCRRPVRVPFGPTRVRTATAAATVHLSRTQWTEVLAPAPGSWDR